MLERECARDAGADFVFVLLDGNDVDKLARFDVLDERPPEDDADSRDLPELAEAVVGGLGKVSLPMPPGDPTNDWACVSHDDPVDPYGVSRVCRS